MRNRSNVDFIGGKRIPWPECGGIGFVGKVRPKKARYRDSHCRAARVDSEMPLVRFSWNPLLVDVRREACPRARSNSQIVHGR